MPDRPAGTASASGREALTVRLFGHSSVSFSEDGAILTDMVDLELTRLCPGVEWTCDAELLFIAPNMARRTAARVDGNPPDIAVLRPAEMHFMLEYPIYAVRRRWPALYRSVRSSSAWLLRIAGGGRQGSRSPRGWVYRWPRRALALLVGQEPEVTVEEAVAFTKATIDVLLRGERTQVVFMSSANQMEHELIPSEAARRRRLYVGEMEAYCRTHSLVFVDQAAAAGLAPGEGLGSDGWHSDSDTRLGFARLIAAAVLEAVKPTA